MLPGLSAAAVAPIHCPSALSPLYSTGDGMQSVGLEKTVMSMSIRK